MTRLEAHNIRAQLFTTNALILGLGEDAPESILIARAIDKMDDVYELVTLFLEGMIFDDDKRSISR